MLRIIKIRLYSSKRKKCIQVLSLGSLFFPPFSEKENSSVEKYKPHGQTWYTAKYSSSKCL